MFKILSSGTRFKNCFDCYDKLRLARLLTGTKWILKFNVIKIKLSAGVRMFL